jgi:hypothetical protein
MQGATLATGLLSLTRGAIGKLGCTFSHNKVLKSHQSGIHSCLRAGLGGTTRSSAALHPPFHCIVSQAHRRVLSCVTGASSALPAASQLLTALQGGQKRSLHRSAAVLIAGYNMQRAGWDRLTADVKKHLMRVVASGGVTTRHRATLHNSCMLSGLWCVCMVGPYA